LVSPKRCFLAAMPLFPPHTRIKFPHALAFLLFQICLSRLFGLSPRNFHLLPIIEPFLVFSSYAFFFFLKHCCRYDHRLGCFLVKTQIGDTSHIAYFIPLHRLRTREALVTAEAFMVFWRWLFFFFAIIGISIIQLMVL